MTDTKALRFWIGSHGLKLASIAKELGINPYSLQRKIDNLSEFRASEIAVFTSRYGMSVEDRNAIFFSGV